MHTLSTTALQRQSTEVPIPSHFTCLFRSTFCMFCNPLQHQPPSLARALHYQSSPLLRCKSSNHFLIPGAFCGANLIKMHTHIPGTYTLPSLSFSVAASAPLCRVGQNHIYNIYIRDSWQKNHQIYGHIRCIYIRFWPTLPVTCVAFKQCVMDDGNGAASLHHYDAN